MESRFESEFNNQSRERFDEVSEKEQIQRFVNLKSLFADKEKLIREGGDEEKIERANYFDFIENAYKYPNEIKLKDAGKPIDYNQYTQLFSEAETGNKIIKEVLKIFLKFKKNDDKLNFNLPLSNLDLAISNDASFLKKEDNQVSLDTEKLKGMFRWCLVAFVKKGESIGRKPSVNEEEIDKLCDDIEDIINQINPKFAENKTFNLYFKN